MKISSDRNNYHHCRATRYFSKEFEAAEILASLVEREVDSEGNTKSPYSNETSITSKMSKKRPTKVIGFKMKFPMQVSY